MERENPRNLVDRHDSNNLRILNANAGDPMMKHEPAPSRQNLRGLRNASTSYRLASAGETIGAVSRTLGAAEGPPRFGWGDAQGGSEVNPPYGGSCPLLATWGEPSPPRRPLGRNEKGGQIPLCFGTETSPRHLLRAVG